MTAAPVASDWKYTRDLSDGFFTKLHAICDELGCSTMDMLGAMNAESGVRSNARNPRSSATGLIQWMADKNGLYYGLTRDAFAAQSAEEQLPYVRRYFWPHRGRLLSAAAVYTAIFLPAFVDHAGDPDFVLCARSGYREARLASAYAANAVFDNDADGRIQIRELELAMRRNWRGCRCSEIETRSHESDLGLR